MNDSTSTDDGRASDPDDDFLGEVRLDHELEPPLDPTAPVESDDRYLRLLAEFENFRRRSRLEREQAAVAGIERLAVPMFGVLENLERALSNMPHGVHNSWVEGIRLTERRFVEAFRAAGLEPIDPLGEPFDPRFHEALGSVADPSHPADHVAQVVARGWRFGDRVLRPARVLVAAGPGGA